MTVAALVTAVQVSQAFPFFQDPALHVTATESEALVHVTVAALVTAVHCVTALASAVASLKYPALAVQHLSLSLAVVQAPVQEVPVAPELA